LLTAEAGLAPETAGHVAAERERLTLRHPRTMLKRRIVKGGVMRVSFWLALAVLWLSPALYSPAFAQTPAWQLLRGNSGAPFGRVAGSGNIALLSLACSQGKPIMLVALRRAPARNPARLALTIGSQTAQIAIQRTANPAIWGAVFADGSVLDMVAAGQQASLAIDGAAFGGVSLAGAGAVMREALGGCWGRGGAIAQQGPNSSIPLPNGSNREPSSATGNLPVSLANDIADFDQSCRDVSIGRAVLGAGAIQRADFNSDGIIDYLFDGTKIHCSKQTDNHAFAMAVYSSTPEGKFKRSLSSFLNGSVTIMKGARTGLRMHQPALEEGDKDVTETLSMRSSTEWNASKLAHKGWRDLIPTSSPPEISTFFGGWEQRCENAGRPLSNFQWLSDLHTKDKRGRMLDLNGDGKQDYIMNTSEIRCGLIGTKSSVLISDSCPQKCGVFAVVSASDSTYSVQPIERSAHTVGAWEYVRSGNKVSICATELVPVGSGEFGWAGPTVMYSWTGTNMNRRVLAGAGSGNFKCPAG
jgi:hypothetical protein